jgi:hypothetical protein
MPDKIRRRIKVEIMTDNRSSMSYYGRLLGIMSDEDFHVLIGNKEAQSKLFTAETKPMSAIGKNYDRLGGKRIIMTIREIDGEAQPERKFFVTEKLDMISLYKEGEGLLCAECEEGGFVYMEEEVKVKGETETNGQ